MLVHYCMLIFWKEIVIYTRKFHSRIGFYPVRITYFESGWKHKISINMIEAYKNEHYRSYETSEFLLGAHFFLFLKCNTSSGEIEIFWTAKLLSVAQIGLLQEWGVSRIKNFLTRILAFCHVDWLQRGKFGRSFRSSPFFATLCLFQSAKNNE